MPCGLDFYNQKAYIEIVFLSSLLKRHYCVHGILSAGSSLSQKPLGPILHRRILGHCHYAQEILI